MRDPAVRLLSLLSLLQSRPDWTGSELAGRLGVSARTVRNDISRLRELGYPVDAVHGRAGHYRLGVGAALPPLLLDDEEAVAIAVGLRSGAGISGIQESSARALAKLERVLPHRLRRSVEAISATVSSGPQNTRTDAPDPEVDPALLSALAAAVRDRVSVRFDYHDPASPAAGPPRQVEPYRLVSWERRWYLVAREPARGSWQVLRIDWITLRTPGGPRFTPSAPPGDYTDLVLREVASTGWTVRARIAVAGPAEAVLARINPASASSRPSTTATRSWSPAPTASPRSPPTWACSTWTSTSPGPPSWSSTYAAWPTATGARPPPVVRRSSGDRRRGRRCCRR